MGECKAKAIQTALGAFRHNQAYPGITRHIYAYSKPGVTLAYLEPWYIQNSDIQKQKYSENPSIFATMYIQNAGIFKIRGKNS